MADPSLPPDVARRLGAMETQLDNLGRSQNPVAPSILDLRDVAGVPTSDGLVLEYDRSTGTWKAAAVLSPGDVKYSASPNTPGGRWLFADGAAVSRATYADLFAAIGTTWGAGNGSTTFNLPNLVDRFPVGAGSAHALGATGGSADAIAVTHAHVLPSRYTTHTSHYHGDIGGGVAEAPNPTDGTSSPTISSSSAGSSGTGANLPPFASLYAWIRY